MGFGACQKPDMGPDHNNLFFPAEWEHHKACWLAWPCHEELWGDLLPEVRREFVAFVRAILDGGRGESIELLVPGDWARRQAAEYLAGMDIRYHEVPFGDIWLRDTGPIFLKGPGMMAPLAAVFRFNGWGEKYSLPGDREVGRRIAELAGSNPLECDFVLEGGAVEVDGEGTCLTTRQCLLNPNRNPGLSQAEIEERLCCTLGVNKVLWLGHGLLNDHTDGHIDTLARFTSPGEVVCMESKSLEDPNHAVLDRIRDDLTDMRDARGRALKVHLVPSPGLVKDANGRILPASYVNFYVGNSAVVVPTYGTESDGPAVAAIASLFPGRRTVGASARAILEGGGAFHCISQQQPL